MSDVADPRRRLLQFSLRSLFFAILLVAMFYGGRATMQPIIEAQRARADAAEQRAEALAASSRQLSSQLQANTLQLRQELQRSHLRRLESLDPTEAAKKRQLELDRLRDAIERHESEQRINQALEHSAP